MNITGSMVNYYFHCKRQCYLAGNRLNMENNSEQVRIGQAIHKEKAQKAKKTEVAIDNIRLDKLTEEYLTEIKKSDSDVEAARWQLIYYLYVLKQKGIIRKGKLEFVEKNKIEHKIQIIELTDELIDELQKHLQEIEQLILGGQVPATDCGKGCTKCAYYEYCYI